MPSENNLELGGMPYLSQMWQQYWPHLTDTWAQTRGVYALHPFFNVNSIVSD